MFYKQTIQNGNLQLKENWKLNIYLILKQEVFSRWATEKVLFGKIHLF